ncbi:hypothetical protein COOONC_08053, partial [Cooperia oncophora]
VSRCFYLRLPANTSFVISNCSAIFVSVERYVATLKSKTYEYGHKNIGFGLLLLQTAVAGGLLGMVYSQIKLNHTPLYYCQATSRSNFMWSIYPLCALLTMQLLAVFIFGMANRKNRARLSSAMHADLSSRYQNEENLWTIKSLKLYVYTNTTLTATYITAIIILLFNNELFSLPTYYALVDGKDFFLVA